MIMENDKENRVGADAQFDQNQYCNTDGVKRELPCKYATHKEDDFVQVKTENPICDTLHCHATESFTSVCQENLIIKTEISDETSLRSVLNDDVTGGEDIKAELKYLMTKTEEFMDIKQEECDLGELVDDVDASEYQEVKYDSCGVRDGSHNLEYLKWFIKEEYPDDSGRSARLQNSDLLFQDSLCQTNKQQDVFRRDIADKHDKNQPFECETKPFTRNQRDYGTVARETLDKHVVSEQNKEKPFSCDLCCYGTAKKATLKHHIMSKHTEEKPFTCNLCCYSAVRKAMLKHHIMSKHTKQKPFTCTFCDYGTGVKENLKIHIMGRHKNEKPFTCYLCEYCAACKGHLTRHIMRRHIKEKPHVCNLCGYGAVDRGTLKIHMRKHTKLKPFSCNACEYSAVQKGTLKKHIIRMHTKEKPFTCNVCDYGTVEKGCLQKHISSKHMAHGN